MVKLIIFSSIVGFLISVIAWPTHREDQMSLGYIEGYKRAAVDIKIFASGTGALPNEDWVKRAAKYRLEKKEVPSEGIALGLAPDPQTTLQPFQ